MESDHKHPHGLSDAEYDAIFTKDKPIIFAFHGYPTLIHELTYERNNHNISVHGYQEEGTITTPFDMRVPEPDRPFQPGKRCYHALATAWQQGIIPDPEDERQAG